MSGHRCRGRDCGPSANWYGESRAMPVACGGALSLRLTFVLQGPWAEAASARRGGTPFAAMFCRCLKLAPGAVSPSVLSSVCPQRGHREVVAPNPLTGPRQKGLQKTQTDAPRRRTLRINSRASRDSSGAPLPEATLQPPSSRSGSPTSSALSPAGSSPASWLATEMILPPQPLTKDTPPCASRAMFSNEPGSLAL